jgi:hypothetical protein
MPFGGGGSSSVQPVGQQTTVQKSDPWEEQKPYLRDVFIRSEQLANQPRQYYPGSTVVAQSGQTLDALNAMENRARTGSPIQAAGADQYLKTLQGGYLNSNPYLDAMYDRAARPLVRNFQEAIAPTIQGNFAKAGRYGSEAYRTAQGQAQDTLSRSLGEMATDIYGRSYESERARQDAAMQGAPQYAQSDYLDAMQLMGVGGQHEAQAALNLQDAVNRWNFAQEEPWARLAKYGGLVQGNYGQTNTMTQPIYRQQQNTIGNIFQGLGGLGLLGLGFL